MRASLFQISGVKKEPLVLPDPEGDIKTLTEKVYVPVKEHPDVSIPRGTERHIDEKKEQRENQIKKDLFLCTFCRCANSRGNLARLPDYFDVRDSRTQDENTARDELTDP